MGSYFRRADPFFDEQENHSLIGVANVFLSCLFYDVKLQYAVPIINQKGEVSGHRLFNLNPLMNDLRKKLRLNFSFLHGARWLGVFMWR